MSPADDDDQTTTANTPPDAVGAGAGDNGATGTFLAADAATDAADENDAVISKTESETAALGIDSGASEADSGADAGEIDTPTETDSAADETAPDSTETDTPTETDSAADTAASKTDGAAVVSPPAETETGPKDSAQPNTAARDDTDTPTLSAERTEGGLPIRPKGQNLPPSGPAGERPATGDPAVDALIGELSGAMELPVDQQVEVLETIHRRLQDRLADVDDKA